MRGHRKHGLGVRCATALVTAAAAASLAGCVLSPPVVTAAPAPAPPPPTATPTPFATSAPRSEAPSASPRSAPSATPSTDLGPPVGADGCAPALIEAITFGYDPSTYQDGFLHPEILDGFDVPCSGMQPSEILPTVATFSFALVRADDGVLETLDARILATGLTADPMVSGVYQDAATDPIAFLDPMPEWQESNETAFEGPEDWVVLMWYAKP